MKVLSNKRYDATVSIRTENGYKLHSFLSNRLPDEVFLECALDGFKEDDLSIFWTERRNES